MGIGFTELIILAAISLVIMGPEKFPDFAKIVIRTMRDLRGYVDDVKSDLTKEMRPIEREVKQLSRYDTNAYAKKTTTASTPKTTAAQQKPEEKMDAQNVVDSGVGENQPAESVPQDLDTGEATSGEENGSAAEHASDEDNTASKAVPYAADERYPD